MRSRFFEGMFTLPRAPDEEGETDENPIILQNFSVDEFDHLLTYIFSGPCEYPQTVDFLASLLKLSTFLEIKDGFTYATALLESNPSVSPAYRIRLASLYRVDSWIEPAFRELLQYPVAIITHDDVENMGFTCIRILMQTKSKIDTYRKTISQDPPSAVNGPDCKHPTRCAYAWSQEWWNGLAKHLLHPDVPVTEQEALKMLEEVSIPQMCKSCQDFTVLKVMEKGVFTKEEQLIKEGLNELMDWQTDKAIRAAMLSS